MNDFIEIKKLRKQREKHFLKPDGTMLAVLYDDNIHYLDHGEFKEIDPTLEENDLYYINKKNAFTTSFSKQTKNHLLAIHVGKQQVLFSLKNANVVQSIADKNKVTYENILDQIDFVYELLNSQVKESIVLKERRNPKLSFDIKTTLALVLQENKRVNIIDQDHLLFYLEAPYMIDTLGKRSNDCFYELQKTETGYLLTLKLDETFLNDPNTVYPVLIDPTITNKMQSNNVYDTYIYEGDTNVDRNSEDIIKVGFDNYNNINKVFRTLLKFELPTIGTGYEIINAYVNLVSHPSSVYVLSQDTPILDIYPMTQDWSETTANWSTMYNKYNSKMESSFKFIASDLQNGQILLRNNVFDITNMVKKWYSGTPNYGMMLKSDNETNRANVKAASFCSKNYTGTSESPKPLLIITYQNQNGLENYFSYQQQSFTSGTTNINTYNGNLTGVFELGKTIGSSNPIHLSLVYNTNDVVINHNIGYGVGYQLSYHQTIKEVTIEGSLLLEYLDGDGTIHYFNKKVSENGTVDANTYVDEDGLSLTITKQENNYKMTDKEQNTYLFTKNGDCWYLTEIKDTKEDKTIIAYNNQKKIESIKDARELTVSLIYEENKTTIISPSETTVLNYQDGRITSLVNKYGTTSFIYNDQKILTKVIDTNQMGVIYEYYSSPYKVKKIQEFGLNDTFGNFLEFSYSFQTTTVTDQKGRSNTYTFNERGNNVGVTSLKMKEDIRDAYAGTNMYGNYTGSINKLTAENATVQYIKNYLTNTSFEIENNPFDYTKDITLSISRDCPRTGLKCLKIEPQIENQYLYKTIQVPKGHYYTFSAYIKNNDGIYVELSYQNLQGEEVKISNFVNGDTDYVRGEITIYYPEDALSDLTVILKPILGNITYIDDVQLEQGEVANYYNLVDNSDFSNGTTNWTLRSTRRNTNTDVVEITPKAEIITSSTGVKMLKLNGEPTIETTLRRQFNISGKAGDTYNLSFWYKNLGINSPFMVPSRNAIVGFHPVNEDYGQGVLIGAEFNRSDEWQFFSRNFIAEYDYDQLDLTIFDLQNANELYITNFSLFKDLENNSYVYDEQGNLTLTTTLNKQKNEFQYDKKNQLIGMLDPKGANFNFEYDNNIENRLLKAISPNGVANEITYDTYGNPIVTKIRNMNPSKELVETSYYIRRKGTDEYLKADLYHKSLSFEKDTCSHDLFTLIKVDNDYRIKYHMHSDYYVTFYNNTIILSKNLEDSSIFVITKNKNGSYSLKPKNSTLCLSALNNQIIFKEYKEDDDTEQFYFETKESELFIENQAQYTEDGRFVTKTIDSLNRTTTYDINTSNGLINYVIDPKGNKIEYVYNDKEQIVQVKNKEQKVDYQYNNQDLLSNILHGTKNYQLFYDVFLNPKEIKLNNHHLITHEYEENNGNLISSTYGNGQKVEFTYDDFNRIKNVIKSSDTYQYKYDNLGNLSKVLSNQGMYCYNYDFAQRLSSYKYQQFKIDYDYDENNNVISSTYFLEDIKHPVIYTYSEDSTLTKISMDNNTINYKYDDLDRIKEINLNDQYKSTYEYITNGKQTSNLLKTFKTGNDIYDYQYDKLNNLTLVRKNNQLLHRYEYNDYNELITDEDYIHQKTIRYTYDLVGNIKSKKEYELFTSNLIHETKYEYANSSWEDQLTKFNDQSITYDSLGNPITIGNDITLSWMNGRELKTYQTPDMTIEYTYDKDGIRTSKTVNNKQTFYYTENNHIIFETKDNNMIYYLREANGDLVGFKYNDKTYYYIKNDSEDILGILDSNYNQIVSYEYDAYGNVLSVLNQQGEEVSNIPTHVGNINPFRYRSYYYDVETKLYYLNSRYYNPEWGRFINVDGIIGSNGDIVSHNLYMYVSNNPITFSDPLGTSLALGMGVAVAAAAATAKTLATYGGIVLGSLGLSAAIYDVVVNWQAIEAKIQQITQSVTEAFEDAKRALSKKSKEIRRHTVYTLQDSDGLVIYVGRTVNPDARKQAHKKSTNRDILTFVKYKEGLNYSEARGLEQSLIIMYQSLNKEIPAANQINGVRWDNPKCHEYMSIAQSFLPENETYVGHCK